MFRTLIISLGALALFMGILHAFSLGIWARTESNFPAHGQFIEIDGVQLHYIDEGDGRPVVLIHGSMLNVRDMEMSLVPALEYDYRVIAFDRPGLGHSTRPMGRRLEDPREQARIIHAALDEMGVAQPIMVGHSWGAAVVLAYAMEFPQDLKGIVLLSGASYPSSERIALYGLARAPFVGNLARQTIVPPLVLASSSLITQRFFGPNEPVEDYIDRSGLGLVITPDRFLNDAMDFAAIGPALAEMHHGYRSIRTPMIIMTGDQDRAVVPEENSYRLHAALVGSELIVLEGIGHMPHHMATDQVVEAIVTLAED